MKQEFTPNELLKTYMENHMSIDALIDLGCFKGIRCKIIPINSIRRSCKKFLGLFEYDIKYEKITDFYKFHIFVKPSLEQYNKNLFDFKNDADGNQEKELLDALGHEFICSYDIKNKEWILTSTEYDIAHYLECDSYTKDFIQGFVGTLLRLINEQFGTKKQKVAKKSK